MHIASEEYLPVSHTSYFRQKSIDYYTGIVLSFIWTEYRPINKKICVFRVTLPYLIFPVKPNNLFHVFKTTTNK